MVLLWAKSLPEVDDTHKLDDAVIRQAITRIAKNGRIDKLKPAKIRSGIFKDS
jgi:predicted transcriptional regulator of viral defense system